MFRIATPVRFSALILWGLSCTAACPAADEKITFDDHVRPLLNQRCASCHNPNNKSGDLDVTNFTALMLGGGSGTVIELGEPSTSYLYKLITHEESPEMPPDGDRLPDAELDLVRRWIEGGALENKSSKAAPQKKKVAAVAGDATVRPDVVPVPCRLNLDVLAIPRRNPAVLAIATSPWAPVVAVGTPFQVLLYDSQTQQLSGVLPFPEGHIHALRFSRNGGLLLAGGGRAAANGVAIAWDIQTGERVVEISGLPDAVLAADISSDHTRIATGSTDRLVRVFDTGSGRQLHEIKKHTDWVQALEFSPDGVLLASGDRSGGLLVWEAKTAREYLDLRGHQGPIQSLSWRVDSNVLASASQDATVRLWEMENGGQIANWNAHGGGVTTVQFTRDSRLVTGGRDHQIKVFNQSGNQEKAYPWTDVITAARLCDETQRLLGSDLAGQVQWRDIASDAELGNLSLVVPKLADRWQATQAKWEQVQAEQARRQAAWQAATEALNTQSIEQQTLRNKQQQLRVQLESLVSKRQQVQVEQESQRGQLASAQENVNKLAPGLTNLTQAIEAVQRSLETMQSDQLETSLKQLTELKQTHQVQLANQSMIVERLPAVLAQLAKDDAELQMQQQAAQESLTALEMPLAELQAALEATTAQVAATQLQLDEYQPILEQTQSEHRHMAEAVAFAEQEQSLLAQLEQQAKQIETVAEQWTAAVESGDQMAAAVAEHQAALERMTEEVATGQAKIKQLGQLQSERMEQVTALQRELDSSTARRQLWILSRDKLRASLALLSEMAEAGDDDPTVAEARQSLQSRMDAKTADLERETAQAAAWQEQLAGWKRELQDLVATLETVQAEVDAAMAGVQQRQADLAPHQAEHEAQLAKITEMATLLEQEQATWQDLRHQLLQLRGVTIAQESP